MSNNRCAAVLVALTVIAGPALAEVPAAVVVAPPPVVPALVVTAPPVVMVKVPEGTEFRVRLEDALSSKTAQEGDRFTISLVEDVPLADGTILRSGYRGVGEVADAQKNGMMGKTGKLSVKLSYLKVGDQRIRLRAQKASEGDHRTGAQVVTVVFFGVFAGLIKGKNTQIPKGTQVTAFADQDTTLSAPLPAPPPEI